MAEMRQFPQAEKKKFTVAIVDDSSHIESAASDAADKKMTASKEQLRGIKGFLSKIWKHNLFKEYYRQKEKHLAKDEIVKSGNAFVHEGGGHQDMENHKESLVKKFTSEYEDENIHKDAGDIKERLGEAPIERKIQSDIKGLIDEFAKGKINETCFIEEKKRILSDIKGAKPEVIDQGQVYADNMLEIAKQVKQAFEHGERLDRLDFDLEVVVGRAKSGVRTEAQFNAADRIVEKIKSTKIGRFVNEATIAGAVGMAYSLATSVSQRLASSRAAAWMSFGGSALIGGAIAGLREGNMFANDVRQHRREMAQGARFDEGKSPRRKELEELRHDAKGATALAEEIEGLVYEYDKDGVRILRSDIDDNRAKTVLEKLAEIEARTNLSNTRKIDLISFSDVKKVEQERQALDLVRGQSRCDLKKILADNPSLALPEGKNADEYFNSLVNLKKLELMGGDKGVEAIDRMASKMKKKHVARAVVKGIGTGLVVGAAAQELFALITPNKTGLVDGFFVGKAHAYDGVIPPIEHITPLEYARRVLFDDFPKMNMHNSYEAVLGSSHFRLPQGAEFAANPDGSYRLLRYNEVVADRITLDKNGLISPESQGLLDYNGVKIKQSFGSGSTKEFMANMHDHTSKISRKLWYDNNTPRPIFDKNELKLWWGGKGGGGIDQNGNYVFSVKHMMPDGSYHKQFSADAQELMKTGKLKMLFSLSKDTQNNVFEVPIDTNGNAVIDPKSEIGKLFFTNEHGHAKFLGKYAEVAQMMGNKNQSGAEAVRILATHVGKGVDHVAGVPMGVFDVPEPYIVDQWFIPAPWRNPLEPSESRKFTDKTREYYYSYGGEGYGLLSRNDYRKRMSNRILENKDIDLSGDDSEIIKEYLGQQDSTYYEELEHIIATAEPMDKNIEVSITIPAYQEGKNIEKTIRNYATLKNREKFELVIFENHPSGKERDDTLAVIERMKREYPDMNIVHLYKAFDVKPAIGNVRKYLVDAVLLRKQKSGMKKSIAIVSNDADLEGINPDYANHVASTFSNKNVDAMGGKWDFPSENYKKMPLLHASQRLWQYLDIAFRNYYLKSPELIGRNSAFRSGIYAAIGGYNENAKLAEDLEIGWLIKDARGYDERRIVYNNAASLVSNSRRAVGKLLSGGRLIQQYGDFHENEEVRKASLEELLKEERDLTEKELGLEVQAIYDHYARMKKSQGGWVEDQYLDKSFRRAMGFLGIQYIMEKKEGEGRVVITDISKLVEALKKYKQKP